MLTYILPQNLPKEIDELEYHIKQYKKGRIDEIELKAFRVPFGIYEQRQKGTYMIRVRCPAGIITPSQLCEIGNISLKFGNGKMHITTRQEIQIHHITIDNIISILNELYKIGLSSRGGGGNTVRNITASPDSGIALKEIFDVTPYAVELTNRMIADNTSWYLPRKFKIAFSNNSLDNAYATVNDVGFVAVEKGNRYGFKVFVAGGMGRMPRIGNILHDFIYPEEVFEVAEAIKRLFSKFGNRRNKHTARLRFLYESLGQEKFFKLYEEERKNIKNENHLPMPFPKEYIPFVKDKIALQPELIFDNNKFSIWKERFVKKQKQDGLFNVIIPFLNGNMEAEKAIKLAEFAKEIGEDTIRFSQNQNIFLRNIPERFLGNLYRVAIENSELSRFPIFFGNAVACAGATTCQLGICNSKGALNAILERLQKTDVNLDRISELKVSISGCPNSCGKHLLADIGFSGKVGYVKGKPYPAYNIVLGGRINVNNSAFAFKYGDIPARNLPVFVEKFLRIYIDKRDRYNSFYDYLQKEGINDVSLLIDQLKDLDGNDKIYFYDWEREDEFSIKERRGGECASGIFDIIDHDLLLMRNNFRRFIEEKELDIKNNFAIEALKFGCRALLITKGIESSPTMSVYKLFEEGFIEDGLIDEKFKHLLRAAEDSSTSLAFKEKEIGEFVSEIERLYLSLDDTLQFHTTPHIIESNINIKKEADLRGVKCPLNFVKVKAALSDVNSGDLIKIILDKGEPSENVPKSVELEGHKIIETREIEDAVIFTIKKG